MKEEIENWKKDAGLNSIGIGDKDCIYHAMNVCGTELNSLSLPDIDEVMSVLANYHIYLAYQMGISFARVKYLESTGERKSLNTERAKLNIIKPVHDSIKVKIDVLKKIYDRRARDATKGD